VASLAPDVLDALIEAGAEPQGRHPGDDDLVYIKSRGRRCNRRPLCILV
jgi:hypothetical protein